MPQTQPRPAASRPASKLAAVSRGRRPGARRFCFYGPHAVGKTTLAAHAPAPIFIDIEGGSDELDVARYPFAAGAPESLLEVRDAVRDLLASEHDYKTLVIDSADRLEALMARDVCEQHSGKTTEFNKRGKAFTTIESFNQLNYGRGNGIVLDELRDLLVDLDRLRKRGVHIIIIAHTAVKPYKNPEGDDYDRYVIRANKDFAGQIAEWVDVLGYCCFEGGAGSLDDNERARGYRTGRRLIRLVHAAAYDAKSRIPMPEFVEMSHDNPWGPFAEALAVGEKADAKELLRLIGVELERIGDEKKTAEVKAACKGVTDEARLSRFLMKLKSYEGAAQEGTN
jgi:hypothetical protein